MAWGVIFIKGEFGRNGGLAKSVHSLTLRIRTGNILTFTCNEILCWLAQMLSSLHTNGVTFNGRPSLIMFSCDIFQIRDPPHLQSYTQLVCQSGACPGQTVELQLQHLLVSHGDNVIALNHLSSRKINHSTKKKQCYNSYMQTYT